MPTPLPPPVLRLLQRYPTFADMERAASRRMPRFIAGYLMGGADAEACLAENRRALERIRLVPRYGIDITAATTRVSLFGRDWAMPAGIAPVGYMDGQWPGSEQALAAAAERAGVPFILSTYAVNSIETVAAIAPTSTWFQLYTFRDEETTLDLVRRAKAAGITVLVITVDIPVYSKRTRDLRNRLEFPPRITPRILAQIAAAPRWALASARRGRPVMGSLMPYARPELSGWKAMTDLMGIEPNFAVTWAFIERVRAAWPGMLVVKGLIDPRDAEEAVGAGADGIIVSNHGGRQLDAAPASIDALPAIVAAVGSRCTVMMDGGIRSGLDVVKGLVRGARMVFVGRPFVMACAAIGSEPGAEFALALLHEEVRNAFGQLGIRSVDEVLGDRSREFAA